MRRITIALAVAALAAPAFAQQQRAPRETVKATVGGKGASVEYGRPSLKGRSFDELIKQLPADRMWRAGVDQVTTLTTETALSVGGKTVPAGKYTVYIHAPESGDYAFVLNKDLGVPLKEIFPAAPPALANPARFAGVNPASLAARNGLRPLAMARTRRRVISSEQGGAASRPLEPPLASRE